ncbi:MAG: OsmC family protein [Thermoplasmata archaeon]|nr:OsmC family protein [Thermoplasmata archaeon]
MTATPARPSAEFPPVRVEVNQVDRYRFEESFPDESLRPLTVDEPMPIGTGAGPDPARALAGAVGHCLSSTLFNTLERSHVRATPIRTTVTITFGRNGAGRKRVVSLEARIDVAPLDESDRDRFDHSVAIFEEYCTVTGSVREGIRVRTQIGPPRPAAAP